MQLRGKTLKEPPKKQYTNAYQLFFNTQKQTLTSTKGNSITKQISKMWKELNKQEKTYYQTLYSEESNKYRQQLELFYGESSKVSKGSEAKPKRPITAIFSYVAMKRKEFKEEFPLIAASAVTKILCAEYKSLPSSYKQQYEEDYRQRFAKYKSDMELWAKKERRQQVTNEKKPTKKTQKQTESTTLHSESNQIQTTIRCTNQKIRIVVNTNSTSQGHGNKENVKEQTRSKSVRQKSEVLSKVMVNHEFTEANSNQSTLNQSVTNEPIFFAQFKRANNKSAQRKQAQQDIKEIKKPQTARRTKQKTTE